MFLSKQRVSLSVINSSRHGFGEGRGDVLSTVFPGCSREADLHQPNFLIGSAPRLSQTSKTLELLPIHSHLQYSHKHPQYSSLTLLCVISNSMETALKTAVVQAHIINNLCHQARKAYPESKGSGQGFGLREVLGEQFPQTLLSQTTLSNFNEASIFTTIKRL